MSNACQAVAVVSTPARSSNALLIGPTSTPYQLKNMTMNSRTALIAATFSPVRSFEKSIGASSAGAGRPVASPRRTENLPCQLERLIQKLTNAREYAVSERW